MKQYVVIEDWDGDGAIRLPDDVLQEMLSKTPRIPDRIDELVDHWDFSSPSNKPR